MRIFWLAFVGKTVAAVFLAICAGLSFGPSEWAAMILGAEPSIFARIIFGLLALGTAATVFGPLVWRLVQNRRSPTTFGAIPIATSLINEPRYERHSGTAIQSEDDQPYLSIHDFFISNESPTNSVILKINLIAQKPDKKIVWKFDATGRDRFGRVIGGDYGWMAGRLKKAGFDQKFVLSPLTLKPKETAAGILPFIMPFALSDKEQIEQDLLWGIVAAVAKNEFNYTLEIEDVFSGKIESVQLPGRYQWTP